MAAFGNCTAMRTRRCLLHGFSVAGLGIIFWGDSPGHDVAEGLGISTFVFGRGSLGLTGVR